jgi:hypothetical protein
MFWQNGTTTYTCIIPCTSPTAKGDSARITGIYTRTEYGTNTCLEYYSGIFRVGTFVVIQVHKVNNIKLFHMLFPWRMSLKAVTMINAIFWDIKPQFVPERKHITSSLQTPAG